MNEKLLEYIDSSFLSPLLSISTITDISFNGVDLFYQDNERGRQKSDIKVETYFVINFIRQIANFSEQQFSYANPILDVSVGRYRINAVHGAIVRVENDRSISFSIRIASSKLRISDDNSFMPHQIYSLLLLLVQRHISLVIGGETGTGKTELQRLLLSHIEQNGRVIVIDNVQELEAIRQNAETDITSWQVNECVHDASFESLIKNAIRSNPDWLIVAEARGKEMSDILNAVMTGHPIITTIHAKDIHSMPSRMARMVMMKNDLVSYDSIIDDIVKHFPIFIYLSRVENNGKILRYLSEIGEYCEETKQVSLIYEKRNDGNRFYPISEKMKQILKKTCFAEKNTYE